MLRRLLTCVGVLCVVGGSAAMADDRWARPRPPQTLIDARIKIFGSENVDRRSGALPRHQVVMSWLTHTTMAVAIRGRVILLDTFIRRLETEPGRTPFVIQDVVDLKPEAIFLGHGHGDHADNAAFIAAKTGAHLYASEETCGALQLDLERLKADPFIQADPDFAIPAAATIACTPVTTTDSTPGTEVLTLDALEPEACIIAFRHLHSIALPADPDWGPVPVVDTPDPRDEELFPPGVPLTPSDPRLPGQQDLRTVGNPGGPVAIWYHFVVNRRPHLTIAFNNTVGAVKEGKGNGWDGVPEDGERILDLLRSLPQTDVQFGTSSSGNTDFNGWRDHVYYLQALQPKIFLPSHAPAGTALQYFSGFMNHLELMEEPRGEWPGFPRDQWPSIRWLTDPSDHLKPMVFDIDNDAWRSVGKRGRVADFCG